jgi:hypothetical protein
MDAYKIYALTMEKYKREQKEKELAKSKAKKLKENNTTINESTV